MYKYTTYIDFENEIGALFDGEEKYYVHPSDYGDWTITYNECELGLQDDIDFY